VGRRVLRPGPPRHTLEQDTLGEKTLRGGAGGRGLAADENTPDYNSRRVEQWASQECGVSWPLWWL
jgi:hypothetical protein